MADVAEPDAGSAANVLVIKLAALGDFIQATGPFAAIRAHHPDAHITLLTTQPYVDLARATGWFNDIWVDQRPKFWNVAGWLRLRRRLRDGGFRRVYDLQTSDRSSSYLRLFKGVSTPEWSGIAAGCSHPHANPDRDLMHTLDRQREQLLMAGIEHVPEPDLSWVTGAGRDVSGFELGSRYAVLVPGGAPHRPAKRWPTVYFGGLARWLVTQGVTPVLLGSGEEAALHAEIKDACPDAISLAGKTDLMQIALLAQGAVAAVGNDTGPMHMISVAGCASVVLFSGDSDPSLCEPRGADVTVIQREQLPDLSVEDVTLILMNKLAP